jgi:SsrA-binding protein
MKILNQKAKFDYEIRDRFEAGIVLMGPEVKSVRAGSVDMGNSFCKIMANKHGAAEVWVFNLIIAPYKHADNTKYDPGQKRKLLLHQKEILNLAMQMKQSRLQIVPTAMYTSSGRIKIEIGLARGKRVYEKREAIKKRDLDREIEF